MSNASTVPDISGKITVSVPVEQAFQVFTSSFGTWWPREYHIGQAEMAEAILEPGEGGRWYERGTDGSECDWGRVLVWDPPHRLVLAWQITHEWGYEPDLAKASEVDVRFTAESGGGTRVDLEHRHFERHGAGGTSMRTAVDSSGGWGGLLEMFRARAEQTQ